MFFKPHNLYRIDHLPTQMDENMNPIPDSGGEMSVLIGGCFLHDIGIQERQGYAGKGITVTYFINLERNHDVKYGQEIVVTENGQERGRGKIVDIKHTSGLMNNYTVIYI